MFHRVKSEVVNEQERSIQAEEKAETKADVTELKVPQTALEIESDDELETETSTNTTTQPEEDTEDMTNNDRNNNEDQMTKESMISPYQRTGTAPAASGYPGSSYPGSAYAVKPAPSSHADADSSDRRLTIGRGITMSGEIESCDYLLVEGTVEAALKGANMLEIAESGTFYGTVEIEEANIAGRFEGDITVNGRLTITAGGSVTGSIAYKELEIEAGAIVDGKLTPLSALSAGAKPSTSKSKAASAPVKAKKIDVQPEPANSDEGLFSKATAAAE